jgi:hypothetical protein
MNETVGRKYRILEEMARFQHHGTVTELGPEKAEIGSITVPLRWNHRSH